MSNSKSIYIKDIAENQQIDSLFLVSQMRLAETKAGKPFLTLTLMDNSGEIVGRVWDNAKQYSEICQPGNVIQLCGQSQSYKSVLQLNVCSAQLVDPSSYDLADYMPSTPYDVDAMENELLARLHALDDIHIKKLLMSFVEDTDLWTAFKAAPAAKMMHHAYIGGLLEHTLGLLRLADSITVQYPTINKSLLFAGVFLHDFGKVKEFTFEAPPINYSDYGRLVGHMVITIELLHDKISQIEDFPEHTAMMIKHLVLSHHGRHEFGSSVLPMIREAFVLHLIDDLDAKMNFLDKLGSKQDSDDYQWSDFQRSFERFLYVRGDSSALDQANQNPVRQDSSLQGFGTPQPPQASGRSRKTVENKPEIDNSKQPSLWEV